MPEIQKDLVLSPNEYAYVLDETKGNVACNVGPHKMSLSQSDNLVKFDTKTKKFIPCDRYNDAISLFVTAPEGWYIALKNPAPGNKHPQAGTSNSIPENMEIGKKINIPGPASFALYPGQMAQVIQGHNLRSNQYLVAKVYDADSLNTTKEDRDASENEPYFVNGQVLIIKGTEISFYIPPTGIEVKAINNDPSKGYVRDAVTLERLEYCILKDEDGNKRYVHGPTVVFPEPTEQLRLQKEREAELEHRRKMFEIESAREAAAADSMKTILEALGPDLAAALTTRSNQAVVEKIAESIAPYAVAGGQPVSRAVSELLRGTTLESVIDTLKKE